MPEILTDKMEQDVKELEAQISEALVNSIFDDFSDEFDERLNEYRERLQEYGKGLERDTEAMGTRFSEMAENMNAMLERYTAQYGSMLDSGAAELREAVERTERALSDCARQIQESGMENLLEERNQLMESNEKSLREAQRAMTALQEKTDSLETRLILFQAVWKKSLLLLGGMWLLILLLQFMLLSGA